MSSCRRPHLSHISTAAMSIYPPEDCCKNSRCPNRVPLKKTYQKHSVIFTQTNGVQPAWTTSLYCPSESCHCVLMVVSFAESAVYLEECLSSYHNNYSVRAGIRTYFPGIPKLIQVGEHQYVETKLAHAWRAHMLFGWYVRSFGHYFT